MTRESSYSEYGSRVINYDHKTFIRLATDSCTCTLMQGRLFFHAKTYSKAAD